MTESKLIRLELGDLVRLQECPVGLFDYFGVLFLMDAHDNVHQIDGDDPVPLYAHTLVRPVRMCELPAVKVDGVVE